MERAFSLIEIKHLAGRLENVLMTHRAIQEADTEFGFGAEEVCEVIQGLETFDFHSSGISKTNGQPFDVYIKKIYATPYKRHMNAYIKLRITGSLIVISFHTAL